MQNDIQGSWAGTRVFHSEDHALTIGCPLTRRCVTTVFCVNASVLGRRIAPLFGPQVADSGFSHIVQ